MNLFDIVESAKKATEEQLSRGGGRSSARFWRPESGENKVRVMPTWDSDLGPQFWREVSQHWNVSDDQKGPILCPKNTPGLEGDCPICELVDQLRMDKSNHEGQRFAKEIKAKRTYLLNVIVEKDPIYTAQDVAEFTQSRPDTECPFEVGDPKIQLFACPVSIFDALLGFINSSQEDITHLNTGRGITIKKIPNKDRIKTRYEVVPSFKVEDTSLKNPAIPDLSKVGFVLDYGQMIELLGKGKAVDLGFNAAPSLGSGAETPAATLPVSDVEDQMRAALKVS